MAKLLDWTKNKLLQTLNSFQIELAYKFKIVIQYIKVVNPIKNKKDLEATIDQLRNFAYSYLERYNPSKQQLMK